MIQLASLIITSATSIAVAWIGLKQAEVKRVLKRTNGALLEEVRGLRQDVNEQ